MALVKMAEEFGGLPMESLIGGPLQAACDAQTMLAGATARFIEEVGLVKEGDKQVVRTGSALPAALTAMTAMVPLLKKWK